MQTRISQISKDYLWLNIRELPYFRGLLRAVEARYYPQFDLPTPILDVGCGDGQFAQVAFDKPIDVGIDPWGEPLREARERATYRLLVQGDAGQTPFSDNYFASAFSNSVLEHIPHLDEVLIEVSRVLRPGASFVFCVPNHQFLSSLSIGRSLDRLGLRNLGNTYRQWFNRIARHEHCDSPEIWQERLDRAGFEIESWWHYYPPASMRVTEWGHYLGLPSLVARKLTGRWIISPTRWNLALTDRFIRRHYTNAPESSSGVCTFYITRKRNASCAPVADPLSEKLILPGSLPSQGSQG